MSSDRSDLQRLGGGGGLLFAATLVGNALLLLLDMGLNGLLGASDYGWWASLRRIAALLGFVGALGVENIVLREVARDPAHASGVVRGATAAAIGASAALGLGLALSGGAVVAWLGGPPGGALDVALVGLTLPLAAARLVGVAVSQGTGRIAPRAVVMFVAWPLVQGALLLPLAWAVGPRLGAVGAYLGAMAVGAALAFGWVWRRAPALWRGAGSRALPPAALLAQTWPLWLQGMLMAAYTWLDQVLLAALAGVAEAGRYGPVAALAPLFGLGLTALNGMFAPMIAERQAAGDLASLGRLYRTVTRWAVALSVPPLLVSLALPEAVLQVWPNGDPTAAAALRITALGWLGCTMVGSVNYLLIMAGHQRATLWNALPALGLSIGLSVALVPSLGATGAALANAGAVLAANGLALWQVRRALGLHPFHAALFRPLLAALPAGVVLGLLPGLGLPPLALVLLGGVLGAALFAGVLSRLPMDEDDRLVLGALARRFRR